MKIDIAIVGEVMIEFAPTGEKTFAMGVAGDTYNTACTIAGLGINVTYITSLGSGRFAQVIRDHAQNRGVTLLKPIGNQQRTPGLYVITNDRSGERCFDYWRRDSAAKAFLSSVDLLNGLLSQVIDKKYLYLSGITLALLSEECRAMLLRFLARYRSQGGRVVFDPNYRPTLWDNKNTAAAAITDIQQQVDVYLPGFDEEKLLFNYSSPADAVTALAAINAREVVIKNGVESCILIAHSRPQYLPITPSSSIIDATGAGDTFNGGYIASRIKGLMPLQATTVAIAVAAEILTIPGGVLTPKKLLDFNARITEIIGDT